MMSKIRSKARELGGGIVGSWSRRLAAAIGNEDLEAHGSWSRRALGGVDLTERSGSWKTKLVAAIDDGQFDDVQDTARLTEGGVTRITEDGVTRVLEGA